MKIRCSGCKDTPTICGICGEFLCFPDVSDHRDCKALGHFQLPEIECPGCYDKRMAAEEKKKINNQRMPP